MPRGDVPEAQASGRLPLRVKVAYGAGEIGEGVKTAALETFLFFYFVQVVGLPGTLTGLALALALLIDGVVDPFVGAWSDRTRSRLGRRHPFLYAAPVPLAAALVLLFSPPDAASDLVLFTWLLVFTSAARMAMTLYFVPHMALGAELSDDFHERVSVGGYRVFFGYVGRILALGVAFSIFFKATEAFPNAQLNPAVYPPFALACGAIVLVAVIASALGTQSHALRLRGALGGEAPARLNWIQALRASWRSKSFRVFFYALLLLYVFNGVQYALALHMNTYFWRLGPTQIQTVMYAQIAGFIVGIPLARPLAARFDKKRTYMAGVTCSGCLLTLAPTLRLFGLFPENGSPELAPTLTALSFIYGLVATVGVVLSAAMLADLSDEYEARERERAQGLFFGVNAFSRKATLGLGGALAGVLVDLIGFPARATPEQITPEILQRLGIVYGPGILGILLLGVAMMRGYEMTRARHAQILQQLSDAGAGISTQTPTSATQAVAAPAAAP